MQADDNLLCGAEGIYEAEGAAAGDIRQEQGVYIG
jgi:hypothetical protein